MVNKEERKFDLEERTENFAIKIVQFAKKFPNLPAYYRLIPQLIGAGTSIAANYHEATEAESKSDFIHKISICKKESKETKFWLRLFIKTEEENIIDEANILLDECHQLHLIFSKIVRTCKENKKN